MSVNLTDENKFEILKEAYIEQRKEISFWRERSWKVTMWLVSLLLAVSGAATFLDEKPPVILIPLFALSIIATIYLDKNYRVYCERWERLGSIEKALGFFEEDVYIPGISLLSSKLEKPQITYKGTGFFISAIWVMAISTAVAILI